MSGQWEGSWCRGGATNAAMDVDGVVGDGGGMMQAEIVARDAVTVMALLLSLVAVVAKVVTPEVKTVEVLMAEMMLLLLLLFLVCDAGYR